MSRLKRAVLACAKYSGLFRLARLATRGQLRILAYHGFERIDESRFRPQMFQKEATFRRRLSLLRKHGAEVLRLPDAVRRLDTGDLPDLPVVITIDDGWASINEVAVPALREAGMPATVYVTTYYVQRQVPVFGMLVQYLFWKTRCRSVNTEGIAGLDGRAVDLGDGAARDALLQQVLAAGAALPSEAARQELAAELARRLQVDHADIVRRRSFTMMSETELRSLAASNIDVQLHTHRHRFTPERLDEAEHEVVENRSVLQAMVGGPLEHFCYPSGVWGPEAFPMLERLGIRSSTTCEPGLVTASTARQALGRFLDGENIHALEFEAEVCGFLELLRRAKAWLPGGSAA